MKKRFPYKQRILLVNITRLGDMLQATPTIQGMRAENPGCHITVLVEKQFAAVCHCLPGIDEVYEVDLSMAVRALKREQEGIVDAFEYISEVVDDLRSRNFDYVLNMSSSAYTALLLNLLNIENRGGWSADAEGHRLIESDWAKLFASCVFHTNRLYNSINLVDVFRCSADVESHPNHLCFEVKDEALAYCEKLISEAQFSNTGPLVAIQAGASQAKRQWSTERFVQLIDILTKQHNARIVLTGSSKELSIIEPIAEGCGSNNVLVVAGKTNIPQLGAMLQLSDILITGDTGPMHVSIAVGTPVIAMFLASAYGFETGPYGAGNIVLQPVIGCGPCNPNKGCARPDCHVHLRPELLAALTAERLKHDFEELPASIASPNDIIVYRTFFDQFGFVDMKPLNHIPGADPYLRYRNAYRRMWLDDLGGYTDHQIDSGNLPLVGQGLAGLDQVVQCAERGRQLIDELQRLISDPQGAPAELQRVNAELSLVDQQIEQLGFEYPALGLLTRMFVFAKENISGTEAAELASQMLDVYSDLSRRSEKLSHSYNML